MSTLPFARMLMSKGGPSLWKWSRASCARQPPYQISRAASFSTRRLFSIPASRADSPYIKEEDMIPTLPPRTAAKTYPPLVSQTELETYLTPLYRAGWWISETHGHLKPSKEGNPVTVPVSQMSRQYELKSFKSAIQFVNDLAAICAEERHHPIFSVDFNKVSVHVFTHTAHPPPTSKPTSQPHSIPGITSRDLRFATRLESRFRSYLEAGNAVQPDVGSKGGEMWQPVSVHELHIPIRIEGSETLEAWQCPYI